MAIILHEAQTNIAEQAEVREFDKTRCMLHSLENRRIGVLPAMNPLSPDSSFERFIMQNYLQQDGHFTSVDNAVRLRIAQAEEEILHYGIEQGELSLKIETLQDRRTAIFDTIHEKAQAMGLAQSTHYDQILPMIREADNGYIERFVHGGLDHQQAAIFQDSDQRFWLLLRRPTKEDRQQIIKIDLSTLYSQDSEFVTQQIQEVQIFDQMHDIYAGVEFHITMHEKFNVVSIPQFIRQYGEMNVPESEIKVILAALLSIPVSTLQDQIYLYSRQNLGDSNMVSSLAHFASCSGLAPQVNSRYLRMWQASDALLNPRSDAREAIFRYLDTIFSQRDWEIYRHPVGYLPSRIAKEIANNETIATTHKQLTQVFEALSDDPSQEVESLVQQFAPDVYEQLQQFRQIVDNLPSLKDKNAVQTYDSFVSYFYESTRLAGRFDSIEILRERLDDITKFAYRGSSQNQNLASVVGEFHVADGEMRVSIRDTRIQDIILATVIQRALSEGFIGLEKGQTLLQELIDSNGKESNRAEENLRELHERNSLMAKFLAKLGIGIEVAESLYNLLERNSQEPYRSAGVYPLLLDTLILCNRKQGFIDGNSPVIPLLFATLYSSFPAEMWDEFRKLLLSI